jgi:hypothetical protein
MSVRTAAIAVLISPLLVLLAGCMSPEKRFARGVEADRRGDHAAATSHFIRVLRSEPEWPGARERLQRTAGSVSTQRLEAATEALASRDGVAAMSELQRLDRLVADCRRVGVEIVLPGNYARLRTDAKAAAVAQQLRAAQDAYAQGQWDVAVAYLDAAARYQPTAAQNTQLARLRSLIRGAALDDLERQAAQAVAAQDFPGALATLAAAEGYGAEGGRLAAARGRVHIAHGWHMLKTQREPRAAVAAADRALTLDLAADLRKRADQLRAAALSAGSRRLAPVPFWRAAGLGDSVSRTALDDLTAALDRQGAAPRDPFVRWLDSEPGRARVRRLRLQEKRVGGTAAVAIAAALDDVDYVVVPFVSVMSRAREAVIVTPVRGAAGTTARIRTGKVSVSATIDADIFDAADGTLLATVRVEGVSRPVAFAELMGAGKPSRLPADWRRRVAESANQQATAERELIDSLTADLATAVAVAVSASVP